MAKHKITTKCETCGKPIEKWPSQIQKYCSRACYHEVMKGIDLFMGKQRGKKQRIRVEIDCANCGKRVEIVPSLIGIRKYCSKQCYLEKHTAKIKNIKALRDSHRYKRWRASIYKRDNFTCQVCHQVGINLRAHHIEPVWENPDRIFDIDNGVTLCKECHKFVHSLNNDWKPKRKSRELLGHPSRTISSQALQECDEGSTTNAYDPERVMKRQERATSLFDDDIV